VNDWWKFFFDQDYLRIWEQVFTDEANTKQAEADFDAISGVVRLNWYWSGPGGSGEKHADWRSYTPTQIVALLERAGLHFAGSYRGLSKTPYKAEGPEAGGRLAVVSVRED